MPKDKIINFKVEEEVKKEFESLCQSNHSSASHELRLFVHSYIKRNKGSEVLLSNLNQRKL